MEEDRKPVKRAKSERRERAGNRKMEWMRQREKERTGAGNA